MPKSPLAGAIGYALRNWSALTRYLEDGRLKIDNNGAEQALRPIVLGRKNWLFVHRCGTVRFKREPGSPGLQLSTV